MAARYQLLSPWPEQAIAFTTAVERVARLIGRARYGMATHFELTVPGWRLLRLVEQSSSRATLTHLARQLHVTRPSARETASRLCDIGYLSIGRSPGDRRRRLLTVTDAGIVDTTRILDRMARRLRACETVLRRQPRRPATG